MCKTIVSLLLLFAVCFTGGCGDGGGAVLKRRSNLQQLGIAYHAYLKENGKSASGASQLCDFMRQSADRPPEVDDAIVSLEEGDIVMLWDADLSDTTGNKTHLLGFEAGVPATGGYVVMADGTVRLMTVKEYSEATQVSVQSQVDPLRC